jgi:hypothetical protein
MTDKIVSHAIEQGIDFLFANRLSGQVTLGSTVAFSGITGQRPFLPTIANRQIWCR